MTSKANISAELARQIGNLFYAIAKADRTLSFEEYVKLTDALEKYWTVFDKDSLDLIKSQFNVLQEQNQSSKQCFKEFLNYLHQHPEEFNKDIKELILKTANDIAYAFAKINKSELNLMAKLSLAFKRSGL